MDPDPKSLLQAAVDVAKNSYAPYSRFSVGCAVECADGSVFTGTNMENASYGLTMCAEVGALQSCLAAGKHHEILRMAVVGGSIDQSEGAGAIVTPCGRCRQLILEASLRSGTDIEVCCADRDLTQIQYHKISELLPYGFGPANVGAKPA